MEGVSSKPIPKLKTQESYQEEFITVPAPLLLDYRAQQTCNTVLQLRLPHFSRFQHEIPTIVHFETDPIQILWSGPSNYRNMENFREISSIFNFFTKFSVF